MILIHRFQRQLLFKKVETNHKNTPPVIIIVAISINHVIGQNNKLPWRLPEDLKRFKEITMGHSVIMGRKTYESIGRTLSGRKNIILSRQKGYWASGAEVVDSLKKAISSAPNGQHIFIIGGEQIYREALPLANRIEITEVMINCEGDAFFPILEEHSWKMMISPIQFSQTSNLKYRYKTLLKIMGSDKSQLDSEIH